MTEFKVGDLVYLSGDAWSYDEESEFTSKLYTIRGFEECDLEDGIGVVPYFQEDNEKFYIYKSRRDDYSARLVYRPISESPAGLDAVNPSHYVFPGGVQVIDITRHLGFLEGNAVKYLCRAGRKGDRLEDLKKAHKYIDYAIEDAERS